MKLRGSSLLDATLIAASLLYGGYLLVTAGTPTGAPRDGREQNLLPGFVSSELTSLQFQGAQGEFKVQADPARPGEYLLAGDAAGQVDVALVRELSSTLEFATFKRRLRGAVDVPSAVRSQGPQVTLHIKSAGQSFEVCVYAATATSESSAEGEVYIAVRSADQETWGVTSARVLSSLLRSKQEFRGSQLFPFSMSQTLGLRINDAQTSLELRGDESGFLIEPLHKRADRILSDVLFFQLAQAKLTNFIAPTEARPLVQADPLHKTIVQHGAGKSVTVLLGGSCPGDPTSLVALRTTPPEIAGCATRSLWAGLSLGPDELVARSASTLNPDEIDHVILSGPRPSLDILRKGADFVRLDADQQTLPSAATDELLQVLARGKLSFTPAPASLGAASRTVTVIGQTRAKTLAAEPWSANVADRSADAVRQVIDIYDLGGSNVLAHRLDDDTWFSVPPSMAWAFSQDDTWTKSRVLLDVPADQVSEVRVVLVQGAQPSSRDVRVVRDGSSFSLLGTDSAADQSLCRGVFEGLAHLTAQRYLAAKSAPERVWYRVHITRGGEPPAELIVGQRVRGGYQAWFSLAETQFVLPEEMALRLATPLFDRSPAQLDPDRYATLRLTSGGREITLKRVAGELYPDSEGMNEQDVAPLLEALRGLSVLAHLPDHELTEPAELTIDAQSTPPPQHQFRMEIVGLRPYQDGYAYWARVRGQAGSFVFLPASVQTLKKLL
jgi:hypothetical protein